MRSRLPRALLALGPRDGGEPQDADNQRQGLRRKNPGARGC